MTWKFIIEHVPWWGGFCDRLLKSVKEQLRKILERSLIIFEEMTAILADIEVITNMGLLRSIQQLISVSQRHLHRLTFFNLEEKTLVFIYILPNYQNKTSTNETLLRRKRFQSKLLKWLWIKWKKQCLLNLSSVHQFNF